LQDAIHRPDQAVDMRVKIAAGIDLRGVVEREALHRVGQLVGPRHGGTLHQHRDDRDFPRQRGLDLDPHRVGFVGDPQPAALAGPEPVRPDHRHQHIVVGELALDVLAEIDPERDAVDVHEDGAVPEMPGQPVANAAGNGVAVRAAVGNRDFRHSERSTAAFERDVSRQGWTR
jgi:hypothetical protein